MKLAYTITRLSNKIGGFRLYMNTGVQSFVVEQARAYHEQS